MDLGAKAANGASQCMIRRFVRPINRVVWCPRRRVLGADNRSIQGPLIPIDQAMGIQLELEGGQDAIPCPVASPPGVAVVDRLMRAIACGNIRPRRSGMQAPKDAIDDGAMGTPRGADLALIRRQFGCKEGILGISQIVASPGNRLDYGK
jgi:hypothetical protein